MKKNFFTQLFAILIALSITNAQKVAFDFSIEQNKTHLTFADRNRIQGCLANNLTFRQIAINLHKSSSTISREIKAHMFVNKKPKYYSRYFNDCLFRDLFMVI